MDNDSYIKHEIKELYSMGESIENIAERFWITTYNVKYYCGLFSNSPNGWKYFIKDSEKREAEIKRLSEKRGKSYKDIVYLSYLRGNLTKELYNSAFNTN